MVIRSVEGIVAAIGRHRPPARTAPRRQPALLRSVIAAEMRASSSIGAST